ncbi:MAG: hypothetical protein OHK0028_00250 [Deltaproteobacteria bacterium]
MTVSGASIRWKVRKTSLKESAAQWNLDALVEAPAGDLLPCFVSVTSSYCTVQAPNTADGESLLGQVGEALHAPPSSPPQAVKGGSCGGEEEDGEFPFTGSMLSATWDFPKERREEVLAAFRGFFSLVGGDARVNSYVELVRRRFEDRAANLLSKLDELPEAQLRYTMRLFGDCLDEATRGKMFEGYSEHLREKELREFARTFVPDYTKYAVAELEEKKKGGERFEPPFLTREEYQEMAVREKWPRIAEHIEAVDPLQLRREVARAAMLFRPYMLSDPGFNEGVLEFSLYYDLLDRLDPVPEEGLRETAVDLARGIARAVAAGSSPAAETLLKEVRFAAAKLAGLPADPESLLGPPMEKVPREVPPEFRLRDLARTLDTLSLKDLRLTALVHLDLLTVEETRRLVSPFFAKYASFFEMPSKGLRDLVLAVAEGVGDRTIAYFFDRYGTGRMAMTKPVDYIVWKLMPLEERIAALRRDNEAMDAAMMSRLLARVLHSGSEVILSDVGRQIALLTDGGFEADHGTILKRFGSGGGERIKRLFDAVTLSFSRMVSLRGEERETAYREMRRSVAEATGIPPREIEGEGEMKG